MKFSRVLLTVFLFSFQSHYAFSEVYPESDDAEFYRYSQWTRTTVKAKDSLSLRELQVLYQATIENPVSRLESVSQYDPTREIGFCFGRAMTAHLGAIQMGLAARSIAKLFIVGALCQNCRPEGDPPEWRFHVTTLVRGPRWKWYAIDPIMHRTRSQTPLTAEAWIAAVRRGWDRYHGQAPRAKLYFTPADAVLPDLTTLNDPEQGTRIIELNFEPERHQIEASPQLRARLGLGRESAERVYELTSAQANEYFLTLSEQLATRFNFLGLSINHRPLSFNRFFAQLLDTELNPNRTVNARAMPDARLEFSNQGWAMDRWQGGFTQGLLMRHVH